ncbi:3',5'-cyclic-nucleotide phosphodiesterase [Aliidiomarina quisquiliarum]|uniref:3',5'-cyclic-nucleotide phosphodiesterase n=1 Tax=Aliidiomarina quisquiliarum TaxID=2938947 RepID=UPI00208FB2B2|nr:3',5'-cyclic-nucleotide phosphodiesterase [Aliidiomarina quisquiliarum]MCO4321939.1 3',5'-cyclic-nucleotide phosphodiesterase [Aliidiomarina quisquiliarum]
MKIKVLGCSGGIGGSSGSTCIQIGNHILLDAGSGLGALSLNHMRNIKHVVLSHAHIDHICSLPTFLANLFDYTTEPVTVHALPETIKVLQECVFNWKIWPDFTQLPSPEQPIMAFKPLQPRQPFELEGYTFMPFAVDHTVPTVGYSVKSHNHHFVFAADTRLSEKLIHQLNQLDPIDTLMIECAFPDRLAKVAVQSGHLTPITMAETIAAIKAPPKKIWVTHLKPSYEEELRHVFATTPAYQQWLVLK